jgi:hypothetical protein
MDTGPGATPGEPDWRVAVSAREEAELARVLSARLPAPGSPRSVSVTDLLAPRRAFWRQVGPPVAPSPEREARMEGGRRIHRALGLVFSSSGALEVRVRRDGLHGRIDVLADRPIEVKTTGTALPGEDLRASRPEHVDQLGMYCALLDDPQGRLIYLGLGTEKVEEVAAYDLRFAGLESIRSAMRARAGDLRHALEEESPHELPRCPWFGRGCEYQAAGVCDCGGAEPAATPIAAERAEPPDPRPEVARALSAAVSALPPLVGPPVVERFRDLLYPRLAFFERAVPPPTRPPAAPRPPESADLYRRLTEAVEGGRVGEVSRLPTRSEEPDEEVGGFLGEPYLVRTSRLRDRPRASEWLARSPQYALELGLRCVATGTSVARLIVGFERASGGAGPIQVVEMRFDPSSVFSRVWRARATALGEALTSDDPGRLPPCPRWRFDSCDYREFCGCGSAEGRVQWKRTVDAVRRNPSDS